MINAGGDEHLRTKSTFVEGLVITSRALEYWYDYYQNINQRTPWCTAGVPKFYSEISE
jgi:hypothetical protein